ncbi:hypothetical protein ATSB10_17820 [Dyella thiooxydans]|uniref:Uncharacterized protein n=1 Tax=Dyella thiooxydans TaxID=445710 RepID=A0A160N0J7_9GAMM|nr:hypothetical protein [Dyella thiooxydans]AND69236.1 hypothetical protein ATSB10_17820 [Dyella thiooxydans]
MSADAPVMFRPAPDALATFALKQPVPRTILVTAKQDIVDEVKLPPDQIGNLDIHSDGEVGSIDLPAADRAGAPRWHSPWFGRSAPA